MELISEGALLSINIHIRAETPADIEHIRDVEYRAFLNHPYGDPQRGPTEHLLVDALRGEGGLAVSLVAEIHREIVGHIAFSKATIAGEDLNWYGLGPLAVLPLWQKQGVGTRLMHAGLEAITHLGARGCVLAGDPAYYGRFGFIPAHPLILPNVPAQYFLKRMISGQAVRGEVVFHPAFLAHG